ncbi:galactose mutarotase [Staphylococcus croceilyticus]|uniref:Aldose 1-epimerase n=1 Tax=Staphylococcus croceilyticus TaxID=319942 RepID=A0ABY2KA91_9STAP|nr:aldose epimerase family protein [Staphylococcus croceilyticus]PNZ68406.1 galactose mutarotase [Staphylococcus croceilyticus]TGA72801.1 galactose mutarotase [Staphylococcus croceilyticus]
MKVEVENQNHGIDLIKIDNEETNIVFTNYGARIVSWKYHDNNIILGNRVEADEFYPQNPYNFGATIGRYAGRIGNASFTLNNQTYQLEANNGPHHLHGGSNGLDKRLFDYEIKDNITNVKIIFTTQLQSKEDGYPGDMTIKVIHTYDMEHRWTIEYEGQSNEDTLFNPTNHVYFNLNRDNNVIDNHKLTSSKLNMYPIDDTHLISNTQTIDLIDIFKSDSIYFKDIFSSDNSLIAEQVQAHNGLDHPFEIGNQQLLIENNEFALDVETTMPNVVVFTFNHTSDWKSDFNIYKAHSGVALETQFLPNDINIDRAQAKSILKANEKFYSKTIYHIAEKKEQ